MGVEPIATLGQEFDPNFHEAVAAVEAPDTPPNTILEEMLRGYRIGNRVIRHSMVKVTTGAPAPRKAAAEQVENDAPETDLAATAAAPILPPTESLPEEVTLEGLEDTPAEPAQPILGDNTDRT
jgi:hypothetical protein